ncbi:hypothetical protein Fmac_000660 [Flemingia macrophylla]|uniref:Uncharacterized protein n=1 Tax=Flemingia macrophylla TaxID=520843 RepID=A0ABD1NEW1_9FABA
MIWLFSNIHIFMVVRKASYTQRSKNSRCLTLYLHQTQKNQYAACAEYISSSTKIIISILNTVQKNTKEKRI